MRLWQNAKKIRRRGGDTIIEVTVSAIIFLLALAVLQGAVVFCQKALSKNSEMRANYSAMMQAIPTTAPVSGDDAEYVFYGVNSSGDKGATPVFHMNVSLGTRTVSFQDTKNNTEKTITFSVFTAAASGS